MLGLWTATKSIRFDLPRASQRTEAKQKKHELPTWRCQRDSLEDHANFETLNKKGAPKAKPGGKSGTMMLSVKAIAPLESLP